MILNHDSKVNVINYSFGLRLTEAEQFATYGKRPLDTCVWVCVHTSACVCMFENTCVCAMFSNCG